MLVEINDQCVEAKFGIEGLQFEPNTIHDLDGPHGWFTKKLISSDGPLISDFVTHEATFRYSTYGIHIGQDDRLTFMGENGKRIHGYFVDCREGSPTLHKLVAVDFAPSLSWKEELTNLVASAKTTEDRIAMNAFERALSPYLDKPGALRTLLGKIQAPMAAGPALDAIMAKGDFQSLDAMKAMLPSNIDVVTS